MKSLKDYSLNLTEEEYHALPAWSYSVIARYAREGFSAISTLHEPVKQNDAMRFGSLFDAILTHEGNAENEFLIMNSSVPEAERKVLDVLATISTDSFEFVQDKDFQTAITATSYQPRWKFETQIAHLQPYADYYNGLKSGKEVVSRDDWNDAMEMYNAVKSSEFLKEHFQNGTKDGIEYIYQAKFKVKYITGNHGTIELKIMPDLLEVDHNKKTIRPWDVKTSGMEGFDFAQHWVKMRYDIQAQLYTDVLQAFIMKTPEYKDYFILPYLFMDISRVDKVPVTFEYDPRSFSQINGLSYEIDGKTYTYKNYRALLDEILFYEENQSKVPSSISLDKPNDLLKILSK